MLSDLGMRGRLSLEQAKGIKAKRELAQELRMFPQIIDHGAKRHPYGS